MVATERMGRVPLETLLPGTQELCQPWANGEGGWLSGVTEKTAPKCPALGASRASSGQWAGAAPVDAGPAWGWPGRMCWASAPQPTPRP